MKIVFNQKGQTLLEMLIALFVLVAAVTATTVLIVTSINAGKQSRNKLIANNLAREAIEVVRNIRDSNWIDDNDVAWDDGLTTGVNNNPAYPKITLADARTIDFSPANIYVDDMQIWFDSATNTFLQGSSTGETRKFFRYLYFSQICQDLDGDEVIANNKDNDEACGVGATYGSYPIQAGFRTVVEVHWDTADSDNKVILEERFYNWQIL